VTTVRGVVTSNWTRPAAATFAEADTAAGGSGVAAGAPVLALDVRVPFAVRTAEVHVPLLGFRADEVAVWVAGDELSSGGSAARAAPDRSGVIAWRPSRQPDGGDAVIVSVTAGTFAFRVKTR
jgi:hypothetical protein